MSEVTATTQSADDIEMPDELPQPDRTAVQRLRICRYDPPPTRLAESIRGRGGIVRPMFHAAWEPLSFKYDYNRAVFVDRTDDWDHQWLTCFTNDGDPMGPNSQFGQVQQAFKGLGCHLTKNAVMAQLEGMVFKTRTVEEKYKKRDGTDGRSFNVIPMEVLADYVPPAEVRVVRIGYGGGGGGVASSEPTAEVIDALKKALHGKTPAEYMDVVVFGGNPTINIDPLVGEASDPERLTERLVRYGGKVMGGRIYFPELE